MNNTDEDFVQPKDIPIIYVDTFRIGHDAYKFVFDFGHSRPNVETPEFRMRAIMNPDIAKEFLFTLDLMVKKYEELLK